MIFLAIVTLATYAILIAQCKPLNLDPNICPISPNFSLLLGATIGALTVVVFYYAVEATQKELHSDVTQLDKQVTQMLEIYARAYIVRTCLLNLQDIFKGELKAQYNVVPNDANRRKFLGKLNEKYLQVFGNADKDVREIYDLATAHSPIAYGEPPKQDHAYSTCPECRSSDLVGKIQRYLAAHLNPGLED